MLDDSPSKLMASHRYVPESELSAAPMINV